MLIWMSGIERISPDLFEAATIDGANKPQQFRYMTMPLLKGVFKTNITMWTVSTAAFFVWSQLFSTVTADKATIVPVQYMYMHTFGAGNAVTERNAGYGAAIGIILCVCVVIVFSICNKLIKDDDLEFQKGGAVMEKEKKVRQKINWKKEMKLAPGYIVIIFDKFVTD